MAMIDEISPEFEESNKLALHLGGMSVFSSRILIGTVCRFFVFVEESLNAFSSHEDSRMFPKF
jgi:hypothetical protein